MKTIYFNAMRYVDMAENIAKEMADEKRMKSNWTAYVPDPLAIVFCAEIDLHNRLPARRDTAKGFRCPLKQRLKRCAGFLRHIKTV